MIKLLDLLIKFFGRNNKSVVKALIKVVLSDTEFEIYHVKTHIEYLDENISRLEQAVLYKKAFKKANKEKDKTYYSEGVRVLLRPKETLENIEQILEEYLIAKNKALSILNNLNKEIKIIKKLKV